MDDVAVQLEDLTAEIDALERRMNQFRPAGLTMALCLFVLASVVFVAVLYALRAFPLLNAVLAGAVIFGMWGAIAYPIVRRLSEPR